MSQSSSATGKSIAGYLYIATATFLWAVSATLGRAAFTGRLWHGVTPGSIDPLILSQSRVTFAFLILFPVLALHRGWSRLQLSRADYWHVFVLGVLGIAASNYFYYLAIERTGVATAITVQYTAPVWVLLYTAAAGLQRLSLGRAAAVVLAVVGIVLVVGVFGGGARLNTLGVIAALLAAIAFAFYNISGHQMVARYDHWLVLLYIAFSASLFWQVVNPPWRIVAHHYSSSSWIFLLIFSLVSMLAPFSFYIAGLKYLDPTRAIIVSCLEPVFSIVIAALALGEMVRPAQALGIALVLVAILLVQIPDKKTKAAVVVESIE